MSEPIPESVPTSQDPRSHRPTKKRALGPASEQAKTLDALFAKPDVEIKLPSSSALAHSNASAPPEIVANVQGSSAGAGSGEFHVYKASRRREYERLRAMDEEVAKEKDLEVFEKERLERQKADEERTRKNREKRMKKKGKAGKGGAGKTVGTGGDVKLKHDENGTAGGEAVQGDNKEVNGVEEVGVIIHDDD
jgi:hypothetical protein